MSHQEMTFTPLDELFFAEGDPSRASSYAREWLLMLVEAGYDINAYLEKEKQLHSTQNYLTYPAYHFPLGVDMPRQLVFELGENPSVYWEWWIDPSSPASLVRQEFWHMNPCHSDRFLIDRDSWEQRWPYNYPHWTENCEPPIFVNDPKSGSSETKQWRKRAAKAASRHARQARKKYPKYFTENNENSAIPGAWIEDDF